MLDGQKVLAGSVDFLAGQGVAIDEPESASIRTLEEAGRTIVACALGGRVIGIAGISDSPRDDAAAAVAELRRMGLRVGMITGDNPRTAAAIARDVGIEEVVAGVLPERKASEVRRLQREGHIVAFVGDGINDAPALAAADGRGGRRRDRHAVESDARLWRRNDVPAALQLSRAVMRRIRQNISGLAKHAASPGGRTPPSILRDHLNRNSKLAMGELGYGCASAPQTLHSRCHPAAKNS